MDRNATDGEAQGEMDVAMSYLDRLLSELENNWGGDDGSVNVEEESQDEEDGGRDDETLSMDLQYD